MVASNILVNRYLASRAVCCGFLNLSSASLVLFLSYALVLSLFFFFFFASTLVVLRASLVRVESYIMDCTDAEVASLAAIDVTLCPCVVDLARVASLGETVTEVWVVAEKSTH